MMSLFKTGYGRILLTLLLALPVAVPSAPLDCPPLEIKQGGDADTGPLQFTHGMLWQVSRNGGPQSYLFGTVHISDPRVTDLPAAVVEALSQTDVFVMEARLDGADVYDFARDMFFTDGRRLSGLLPSDYYERAVAILANYNIAPSVVDSMKPWAAFLTMNMPPDTGVPLDLVLMTEAMMLGAEIYGLETPAEQAAVFDALDESGHVQMLKDSICYYDVLQTDMENMIRLYLDSDLGGLYAYRDKYRLHDDDTYQVFMQSILEDRNLVMVERMQGYLKQGNAFIAIGAMHLPGKQGVLNLLYQAGYRVDAVY